MSALIEKVLKASPIEVNGQRSSALHTSAYFLLQRKIFSIKLINYCILKSTHDTDKSKCNNMNYTLVLRHAMQSENFRNGHSCSSCGFIRISNDIYLKMTVIIDHFSILKRHSPNVLFQSKRSIGRFSVHR